MPIYEYKCRACEARFERLTTAAKADQAACHKCGSADVVRLLSVFGVGSGKADLPCAGGACPAARDPKTCGCQHCDD